MKVCDIVNLKTNSKKPLAYRVRPKSFHDIIGQDHLIGVNGVIKKMMDHDKLSSFILYGEPGIGKTTIAQVIGEINGLSTFTFNASVDNKAQLKDIISHTKHYGALLIIDEIHRMKKDIQDFLLPYVERGDITIIGLTTHNPYHSINHAIRSRVHIFRLKPIQQETLILYLKNIVSQFANELTADLSDDVYFYIASASNKDVRSALNILELLHTVYPNEHVDLEKAEKTVLKKAFDLDKDGDNYYALLSAFQKSIRGSDVNASLHYLARLIILEDLESILRRLTVIAYEDIGLANPSVFTKIEACVQGCLRVGLPEARILLSAMVIDLTLSPKSNSAYLAIENALKDIEDGKMFPIPSHIINEETFDNSPSYKYPHDYLDHIVKQQYLPKELIDQVYYTAADTGNYERQLKARHDKIMEILSTRKPLK